MKNQVFLMLLLLCGAVGLPADPAVPANPAARWSHGLPADPGYFPIGVWMQSPDTARRYQAAGVNLYVALWQGPTEAQLAELKAAGMRVFCEQNPVGLAHRADPTIAGWLLPPDEPDDSQPDTDSVTGKTSYGPPIPPAQVVANYRRTQAADPSRPVLLNLSQGVANDDWIGRGPNARQDDYRTYVHGADIVSFDVYPVADLHKPDGENFLWYLAKGLDRLSRWTGGKQRIWNCIECTHIQDPTHQATPHQVRAEVWMSLVHGSTGLVYFVHQFQPQFDEHALLDDPPMLTAVTAINRQIHSLAPVLNSPSVPDAVSAASSAVAVPIDLLVKRHDGALYVFAVGMRNGPAHGSFALHGRLKAAAAEVLGEGRSIPIRHGMFQDDFQPYDVHLYRLKLSSP